MKCIENENNNFLLFFSETKVKQKSQFNLLQELVIILF